MTEEEIKKKWFPICQPGNLVMRTEPDGEISFFLVCGMPSYHQGIFDNKRGIELEGRWVSDPLSLYDRNIIKIKNDTRKQRIICSEDCKLKLSNKDEMIRALKKDYQKQIDSLNEEIKKTKDNIRSFKKTMRELDTIMSERYNESFESYERKSSTIK